MGLENKERSKEDKAFDGNPGHHFPPLLGPFPTVHVSDLLAVVDFTSTTLLTMTAYIHAGTESHGQKLTVCSTSISVETI